MKHFFRGGRGMPQGKGEQVNMLSCVKGLNECPKEQSKYVLECERFLHYGRNDGGILRQMVLMIFCVLFSSLLVSPAFGQEADGLNKVQPLMIGSKVPDEFWTKEHLFYVNGDTIRKTLEVYKGKLLVLDFWSISCASCLLHQKEIALFKDAYKDQLAVVMVNPKKTKDDLVKIQKFSTKYFGQSGLNSIVLDEFMQRMFTFAAYPHYIWINKYGYVQTQTFRNLLDRNYVAPFIDEK